MIDGLKVVPLLLVWMARYTSPVLVKPVGAVDDHVDGDKVGTRSRDLEI